MTALAPGVYRSATHIRAVAKIGRGKGKRREKRFSLDTALRTITNWQEETRTQLRKDRPWETAPGTLEDDVTTYLTAVESMPTFAERKRHLLLWIAALGGSRKRAEIKPVEIRAVLERWQTRLVNPLSGASCNRRLAALSNVYTVLDGRHERNPCKAVAKYAEAGTRPRLLTYTLVEALLAAMPNEGRAGARGTRPEASQTKARLRVMAYCNLPHVRLKRLRPADVDWFNAAVWLEARRKGRGRKGRWLPLSTRGLDALKTFATLKCWGTFSTSSMWKSFQRAAVKVGRPDLTPYDLRHLFASTLLAATKDTDQVRELMDHSTAHTTRVYTEDAVPDTLRAALVKFDDAVAKELAAGGVQPAIVPRGTDAKSLTVH